MLETEAIGKVYEHKQDNAAVLELKHTAAREVVFRFQDERGKPIENLTINGTIRQSGLTDSKGEIRLWLAEGSTLDGQLFHFDAFERYGMEAFGINLVRKKEESPGRVPPFTIPDTASVHGKVVDESGAAVVGAKVNGSFSQERFAMQKDTYSDRNGRFVLRGIPKNAKVELSARRDYLLSDANSPIVADAAVDYAEQEPSKILLRQQLTARLTGTLVDDRGRPVSGAIVRVNRAQVSQKEGYSNEELFPQLLEDGEQGFRTDAEGRFETQPVVNFDKRFQIEVETAGYHRYRSAFRNGARRKRTGGVLDLGEFKLLNQAKKFETQIRVAGPDGKPLSGAELAVIGAFSGRVFGKTDDQGQASMELQHSPSLLLVRAEGLPVHMQLLDPGKAELNLSIPAGLPGLVSMKQRVPQLRSIAKQLVDSLEQPQPGKSTPYQQLRYFGALATADSKRFASIMLDKKEKYQAKQTIAMTSTNTLFREVPELCMDAISLLSPSPLAKAGLLSGLAQAMKNNEAREEVLGEAVLTASELSGDARLQSTGYVALSLLLDGRNDEAVEFIQESWEAATELQEMLTESRREHKRGVARVFVPYLALLDAEKSLKLIKLTADAQEVPALQSQALVLLSMLDFSEARKYAKQHDVDLSSGVTNLLVNPAAQFIGERPDLRPWFLDLAKELKPSTSKLKLLLMAARHLPAGVERLELIRQSAEVWENAEIDYWYHWTDPCKVALEELPALEQLSNEELSMLIFAAAKTGPKSFATHNDLGVFANFTRLVAMRDPQLGSAILEPVFSG
ncbi:MAG: carboxypeptidase-like regulatory domain-containing protein, partial [Planctomycetota bacterium]